MAGRKPNTARSVSFVQTPAVQDATTQRALDVLAGAMQEVQSKRQRDVVTSDLIVGTNKVRHGLGRACAGYNLTPTAADATFAHALDKTNPRPELEVWVTVIGIAQTAAVLEVF